MREPRSHCSALLVTRLAMPQTLPLARWALTPPFHPYPGLAAQAVRFLLRYLSRRRLRRRSRSLTGVASFRARTFLRWHCCRRRRPGPSHEIKGFSLQHRQGNPCHHHHHHHRIHHLNLRRNHPDRQVSRILYLRTYLPGHHLI